MLSLAKSLAATLCPEKRFVTNQCASHGKSLLDLLLLVRSRIRVYTKPRADPTSHYAIRWRSDVATSSEVIFSHVQVSHDSDHRVVSGRRFYVQHLNLKREGRPNGNTTRNRYRNLLRLQLAVATIYVYMTTRIPPSFLNFLLRMLRMWHRCWNSEYCIAQKKGVRAMGLPRLALAPGAANGISSSYRSSAA